MYKALNLKYNPDLWTTIYLSKKLIQWIKKKLKDSYDLCTVLVWETKIKKLPVLERTQIYKQISGLKYTGPLMDINAGHCRHKPKWNIGQLYMDLIEKVFTVKSPQSWILTAKGVLPKQPGVKKACLVKGITEALWRVANNWSGWSVGSCKSEHDLLGFT